MTACRFRIPLILVVEEYVMGRNGDPACVWSINFEDALYELGVVRLLCGGCREVVPVRSRMPRGPINLTE